jgi:hypothetical protein
MHGYNICRTLFREPRAANAKALIFLDKDNEAL